MKVITHARRTSRLSKIIDAAGGFSVGTALSQARANLGALEARGAEEVERRVAELAAITPPPDGDAPEAHARLMRAYHAANGVIEAAGLLEQDDVCAVAVGLCDLIDAATAERPFDWRVLPIYARSLQLLLTLSGDADGRRQVRESLDGMVSRKLATPG
ncbi:chemotaxis protein CheE [Brevundimonas sp. FT23042]|uniref:chemotaxis protein CheE n=1 Tax=Brevundimonas sp. FT23042 TaxID=3393749 RepID=UPI003B58873C